MTRRAIAPQVVVIVATIVATICASGLASGAPKTPTPRHFSHAEHADRGVAVETCETCHGVGANGVVLAPAAKGHAPCLAAGCHAADFVSVGETTRKADLARHTRASAFCLGCHDSVPVPWNKPTTNAIRASFLIEREYHVEMNHYEHTQKAAKAGELCRSCHIVDPKTLALVASSPGHAQCVACHNAKDQPDFTMTQCGLCHDKPARATYFAGSRPQTDVRACGSEGVALLEHKLKRVVPCFRHERVEHRTLESKPVQCAACHYVVGDKTKWAGRRYQTLKDLHTHAIIDNSQDRQHASCGRTTACHKADVNLVKGAKCTLCHAEKSVF